MNHKFKKPRSSRAGCAMCKPQKNGWVNPDQEIGHRGFGKIHKLREKAKDLKDWKKGEY